MVVGAVSLTLWMQGESVSVSSTCQALLPLIVLVFFLHTPFPFKRFNLITTTFFFINIILHVVKACVKKGFSFSNAQFAVFGGFGRGMDRMDVYGRRVPWVYSGRICVVVDAGFNRVHLFCVVYSN